MTDTVHFAFPYVVTALCGARRYRNVRDTDRIERVTCSKCQHVMDGNPTFDSPRRVAAEIEGLLAREGLTMDTWTRTCMGDLAERLKKMERTL